MKVVYRASKNITRNKIWERKDVWWLNYRETKLSNIRLINSDHHGSTNMAA